MTDEPTGFGNYFESQAVPGALPVGRNSPQRAPLGLVSYPAHAYVNEGRNP